MSGTVAPRKLLPTKLYLVPLLKNPAFNCTAGNKTSKPLHGKKIEIVIPSVRELTSKKMIDVECPFEGCTKVFANLPALQMHFTKGHPASEEDSELKVRYLLCKVPRFHLTILTD